MKIFIIAVVIFSVLLLVRFSMAGQLSKENNSPGLAKEKLQACPDKPNCINTEFPDDTAHYLPPLDFPGNKTDQVMALARTIILEMGGEIVNEDKTYLAATFTSTIFRFVDDFEIRKDDLSLKLHIRSASRVGYSDFGANKRRVKKFSGLFKAQLQ